MRCGDDHVFTQPIVTNASRVKSIFPFLGPHTSCTEKLDTRGYQVAQKLVVSLRRISRR